MDIVHLSTNIMGFLGMGWGSKCSQNPGIAIDFRTFVEKLKKIMGQIRQDARPNFGNARIWGTFGVPTPP